MTQFFRSGIMEYDKQVSKPIRPCETCGAPIHGNARKRFCLPCYDLRLHERVVARRQRERLAREAERADG